MIPDVVLNEFGASVAPILRGRGRVITLPGYQLQRVAILAGKYLGPSRADLFAMVLAEWYNVPLLTGDRDLRFAAENEGVQVFGTLWVLDRMVEYKVIGSYDAGISLNTMLCSRRRLPVAGCEKRLVQWGFTATG